MEPNGELNYFLYKLCVETVNPSYSNYKNFIGEITEAAEEIRRRLLAPYEDHKKDVSGDIKKSFGGGYL